MKRNNHLVKKLFSSFIYLGMLAGVFTLASKNTSAWFLNSIKTEDDVLGETKGAYFAYGNGTKDKPYGIKSPRHLYNLAWLQYLGYFNKESNHEVYFELADNISMEGWTLPPIGTTKYPFIGHFSGKPVTNNANNNTYTISNLTIANTKATITEAKIPYAVKNSDDYIKNKELSNIDIVGLFGCVGDIQNYTGDTYYANSDTETATIHDLNLSGINVTSQTKNTVAGIVAGYLDSKVDNIKISLATNCDSKITVSNLSSGITLGSTTYTDTSKYTSIGYCEEEYETSIDEQTNQIYQPTTTTSQTFTAGGNDNNWGGSLDMESFYNRVTALKNYSKNLSTYSLARKIVLDENGNISSSSYDTSTQTKTTNTNNYFKGYHYNKSEYNSTYNYKIGALNLADSPSGAYGLNGGSYVTSVTSSAYYISSGNNYLSINSNKQLYNSTTAVTGWSINNDGTISSTINGVTYYLYDNDRSLEISQDSNQATNWNKNTSGSDYLISNGKNYLTFDTDTSTWLLKETEGYPTFKIVFNDKYYLARNSSKDSSGYYYFKTGETSSSNALIWYIGDSITSSGTTGYTLYTLIDSEKWYLECTGSNSGSKNKQFYLTNSSNLTTTKNYFAFTSSGLQTFFDSPLYLRYDTSGWGWCYGSSSESSTTKVILDGNSSTSTFDSVLTNENTSDFKLTLTSFTTTSNYQTGKWYYDFEDVSYLPLNVDSSTYEATDKNTGYLIGGTQETTDISEFYLGTVRITNYGTKTTYLAGNDNYTGGSYTNVITNGGTPYTVIKDSSGNFSVENLNANNYYKYSNSFSSFRTSLESSSGLYGFHFYNGSIGMNKIITSYKACILGQEYSNYQLPANSVNFHLKSKGFINFYSGTYGAYNNSYKHDNCFFSVHEVIRDSNQKITDIREIKKIYECTDKTKSNSYLYEFVSSDSTKSIYSSKFTYQSGERKYEAGKSKETTESFTSGSTEETNYLNGYTEIFDTEQLGNRNSTVRDTIYNYYNNIFYFEIPVNDGEYCLGSVEDGVGAYLMYLDIGTNASTISRTTILEQFVQTNVSFTYPTGIVYYYDEKENYICLNIPTNYFGTTTLQYSNSLNINNTNTTVTPTLTYDSSLNLVSSNLTNVNIDEGSKGTTTIIQRLTYIDYNTNDGTTTKIVATKENNGTNTGKYYTLEDGAWVETTSDKVTIYQVGEDNVGSVVTIDQIDVSYSGETIIFTFRIDGKDITISYDLSVNKSQTTSDDGSSIYYDDGDYTINFELNNTTITVTLTKNADGTYTPSITNGTITKNADGTYSIVIS